MTESRPALAPPPPCAICGSTEHSTDDHDNPWPSGRHDVGYPDKLDTEQVLENRPGE